MAEALVSAVLGQLASIARQHVQQEWSLVSGIGKKLESLTSKLEAIRAVLVDAEKRQIKEESVRLWLDKLKAVSYEMDAVLDEWNTAILLRSNLNLSDKVLFYSHSSFHSNQVHRLGLRRRIACKIEELDQKLTDISIERERYSFATQIFGRDTSSFICDRPQTISSIDVSEVYGRDQEKNVLVSKLLCESNQGGRGHDIIPIVGTGGIGKTTLAQLVYNDENVRAHFDLKIWVCVSDPFEEITVARAIIEALNDPNSHKLSTLEALTKRIQELTMNKRFFLVLDDVWTEDGRKWEKLKESLRKGAVGSKILVTTRKESVVKMMRAENHMITIEYLSEQICWSIFRQLAFSNKDECKELEEIGWKIAQKCKGLPLVAKTLGSLMRVKKYASEQWREVLDNELWELGAQVENEIFLPLLLSYYDLPHLEKGCFLYCSYFPKDYMIEIDDLIKLWLSQGLLSSKEDYEKKGIDCFENLAMRSLFQDFEKDDYGNIIGCKMHDIVHDFVMFLTKNECINTLIYSGEEKRKLVDGKAFHCTLVLESGAQIPSPIYNKKNLRTLSVNNLGPETTIRLDLLLSLTYLRSLRLHDCSLERLPKNIDKLIHLRYLSLRQPDKYIKLPETICNLVNLQTLELRSSIRALPNSIGKLVNLRHLYVGKPTILPKELGKLTSLVTLDAITIATRHHSSFRKVMTLEDLGKLNHLKGHLCMGIENVNDVEEVERAQLKSKDGLVLLGLDLVASEGLEPTRKCVLLLEGLQPHPNLKCLRISYYYGSRVFPGWMTSLVNLKTLVLYECGKCEVLGPFGKLPSLEELRIIRNSCLKSVGIEFLGIEANEANNNAARKMENRSTVISFPKLKKLEFSEFDRWEEWKLESSFGNGDDSCLTIMPSLVSLTIAGCRCLKRPLPAFLRETPLQNLKIWDCVYLDQYRQEGMKTEELVKILTSATSEPITDTVGGTDMAEATTSGGDFPN